MKARRRQDYDPQQRREALISAAAWRGSVILRTRRQGQQAILEVQDNGIGMTEDVPSIARKRTFRRSATMLFMKAIAPVWDWVYLLWWLFWSITKPSSQLNRNQDAGLSWRLLFHSPNLWTA